MKRYEVELRVIVEVNALDEHDAYEVASTNAVDMLNVLADVQDVDGMDWRELHAFCDMCDDEMHEYDDSSETLVCEYCEAELREASDDEGGDE